MRHIRWTYLKRLNDFGSYRNGWENSFVENNKHTETPNVCRMIYTHLASNTCAVFSIYLYRISKSYFRMLIWNVTFGLRMFVIAFVWHIRVRSNMYICVSAWDYYFFFFGFAEKSKIFRFDKQKHIYWLNGTNVRENM